MLKPNPLSSLWDGFKLLTEGIAEFLGIVLLVGSLVFLGSEVGLWCLVMGLFSYYASKSLGKTLVKEAKLQP